MLRRTFTLAWYKRGRYVLTVVAIGLSVAFTVSTLLLTTSIADVGEPVSAAFDEVDVVVSGPPVSEGDGPVAGVAAPVPAEVLTAALDAGYDAVGFSLPYAQVIDASGNAGGQAQAAANIAEPWLGDSVLNSYTIVEGVAPAAQGQAALDQNTASQAQLEVGDELIYVTDDGAQQAVLVGIANFGGADNDPYVSTVLLDPSDPLFDAERGFAYVLIAGDGSADAVTSAVLGLDEVEGLVVETGPQWIAGQIDDLSSFLGFFETFLSVFAVISVTVGTTIVANTFTVSLAQRTQELSLLRLVGSTRRQLMSQVVIEAVLLGLVGTAIGIVVGLLGVNAMGWLLDLLGLVIERSNAIAPSALIIGAVVGIGVTVISAVMPARKATAVAPIEALRSTEVEPPLAGRRRRALVAGFIAFGGATLAYGWVNSDIIFTGAGIALLFVALFLGGEYLIRGVARIARPVLGAAGPAGTIASRNLERNAGRTAAAASALMIGVALIAFFTLMAATIGQFIAGDSADSVTSDFVVQGVGNPAGPVLGADLLASLSAVDGVDTVVATYLTTATPTAAPAMSRPGPADGVLGVAIADLDDLDDLQQVFDFDVVAGSFDGIAGADVIVEQATADSFNVAVGDFFEVGTLAGQVELRVGAIVAVTLPGQPQPVIIGNLDLANVVGYDEPATLAFVNATAGAEELSGAVGLATINVLSTDEYVAGLGANLDTILALVYALLAVALIIALVGIANTVSLTISERVGEIAAVRAAGASIRQIFWSLISEFGLLALVGVLSGLSFAWVAAASFFRALSAGQINYPETSWSSAMVIILGGIAGGALAAWLPARSASRSDLLDALRAE